MITATNGEKMITEFIFNAVGNDDENLVLDFADNGNEIFLTDTVDGKHYTITVKED